MAKWLARITPWFMQRAAVPLEGQYRPGPYYLSDGWLSASAGRLLNWWQCGYSLNPYGQTSAMVEACVSAYSQTIAMCPGNHWRKNPDGGRSRITTSALCRILRQPNDYQSISDWLLNLTRRLYENGEAFALAVRNDRGEIIELHLMKHGQAMIAADGSIFYRLSGNEIAEQRFFLGSPIPSREVLHVRLHTPRHPLKGESPIVSTTLDRVMAGAAINQQVSFFLNQSKPSFVLETDKELTPAQTQQLRDSWDAQAKGENAGGTPILAWGLKAKPIETASAADAQIAELLKMSDQNVALAFRVPLAILGTGTGVSSTELLMQTWIASGLGFTLNHIEEAMGLLFGLKGQPEEYLEFNTGALLRSALKDRIEAYARGTISGIFSPDEAREEFDLPEVDGGHGKQPRVQQQVVPLSYGSELKPPDPNAKPPALPAPDPAEDPPPDDPAADPATKEAEAFGVFSTALKDLENAD